MRFQVPQNLDIEDTIIWGLSFKQILYVGGGVGIFIVLTLFAGFVWAVFIGGPILGLGVFLAFFRHNNRPAIIFLQSIVQFFLNKRLYKWRKTASDEVVREIQREERYVEPTKNKYGDRIKNLNNDLTFE